MNLKSISLIFLPVLLLTSIMLFFYVQRQSFIKENNETLNQSFFKIEQKNNELIDKLEKNKSLSEDKLDKFRKLHELYNNNLSKYISNVNQLNENWWNTIINQSGLSLILTLIVIVVTITIGYITKNEINDQIDLVLKLY